MLTLKIFRSYYYKNTYLNEVDLEKSLQDHRCPDKDLVDRIKGLITPEVQNVLSKPLSYETAKVKKMNATLEKAGFNPISVKCLTEGKLVSFPNVLSHDQLPNFLIKSCAIRVPDDIHIKGPINDKGEESLFGPNEGLLRLEMNDRITRIAKKLDIDLVVPKEYAIEFDNPVSNSLNHRYFIICEKLDLQSQEEMAKSIKKMSKSDQVELGRKIKLLIKEIGIVDATFGNIRFTKNGRLAFIDTEPAGLLIGKKSKFRNRGHSIEKCARIGLYRFSRECKHFGLKFLAHDFNKEYKKSLKEVSYKRVILSAVSPSIPWSLLFLSSIKSTWVSFLRVIEFIRKSIGKISTKLYGCLRPIKLPVANEVRRQLSGVPV